MSSEVSKRHEESAEARQESSGEFRDRLPDELVAITHSPDYSFPDNSRRRIPGVLYIIMGIVIGIVAVVVGDDGPFVNQGLVSGCILLVLIGIVSITSGWRMRVDEQQALARAGAAVGFVVGHASAQQVWRGVRSRPTWRVLCYSSENPPARRGLVLVDAVNGDVLEHLVQDNEEDLDNQEVWSENR